MDEETALAIIYSNTKRKKRTTDLLTVAECFDYLRKLYGTQTATASKTGLSPEMVREFLQILRLPKEVKDLVRSRKIDRLDVAYRISTVDDNEKQITIATKLANSPTQDIRDVIRLTKENVGISLETAQNAVLKSKPKNLHVFILDFDERTYKSLLKRAKNIEIQPAQLVKKVVEDWLRSKEAHGDD